MTKDLFAFAAAAASAMSLVPYIIDIARGHTRPHLFTWIVWTSTTATAFSGQVAGGGGAGAWTTGITCGFCVVILAMATRRGDKNIVRSDWWNLAGCLTAACAWLITRGPLISIVLVTLIDAMAYGPTMRKSWMKPFEETITTHAMSLLKHILTVFALAQVTLITALYPAVLVVMNALLVALLVVRRRARDVAAISTEPRRPALQPDVRQAREKVNS